ncbi:glutathione S-transferase [Polaromonas sp. CF318]|uniref:glutathione S-transferase family protein n=1 Tax=Polaromonas sp. CF318 TaxID=1144318 RepID=UPI0002714C9A|nr:glutathione S-transferase family protein [Polaromonas sp. CF318]EJL81000.1 glutathione S-transferase [Polaromonas sp. CF318]
MKLYYSDTLNPRKACAVARHLKLPVEFIYVTLEKGEHRTPEFRAMNPNAKVPVLVDGTTTLWESNAIMCHLAEKAGSDLWPRDERRIEVLRWLMWDATEFAPAAATFYFEHIIKPRFLRREADPAEIARVTPDFERYAGVLEAHLKGRDYLVGHALTVADFAVAITLPYAGKTGLPLQAFPEIRRWHAQLNELPAWREPFPALQAATAA